MRFLTLLIVTVSALTLPSPALAQRGTVTGRITTGPAAAQPGQVVVYLEGAALARAQPKAPRPPKVITQRDISFSPPVTVVVKGDAVEFPNDDKVFHNVFSLSRPARFDLGLYKSGGSKTVTFTREGDVDVYCNIHPSMVAKIKVVPSAFFAMAAADGTYELRDVPPGEYQIVAWQPWGESVRSTVTVRANAAVEWNATLRGEQLRKKQHARKDGTPYGRYQ